MFENEYLNKEEEADLERFYKFCFIPGKLYCLNYTFDWNGKKAFSKNNFISSLEYLKIWVNGGGTSHDCYISYNPLLTMDSRKNENVESMNVIALDVEFADKKKPEAEVRLKLLASIMREALKKIFKVSRYMIVVSGNGVHVYIPIGKPIMKDLEIMKVTYNRLVKYISSQINGYAVKMYQVEISCDDRKDLAGILRIPGTWNSSAKRVVRVHDILDGPDNTYLRRLFFKFAKKSAAQVKKQQEMRLRINTDAEYDIKIPRTIEELEAHPVVQMIFDTELPEVSGWHNTVGFALQALVKFSGIPYYPDIKALEADVNSTWGANLSLQHCNAENPWGPLKAAYNFAKKNGWKKYEDALAKIVYKH
jgi:hypothetical protein